MQSDNKPEVSPSKVIGDILSLAGIAFSIFIGMQDKSSVNQDLIIAGIVIGGIGRLLSGAHEWFDDLFSGN